MSERRVGILGAMPQEIAALLAALEPDAAPAEVGGRQFHRGRIAGVPVVIAHSHWGKVAAATTATTMLLRESLSHLVFTGVAGGVGDGVGIGDIVVGTRCIQHDLDASPIFPRHEIPMVGRAALDCDPTLVAAAQQAATAHAQRMAPPVRVHAGLVGSGDQFVADAAVVAELRTRLPDLLCVEMEGAAVAQVALSFEVPFLVIRTISDRADETADTDFLAFLEERAAPASRAVVQGLLQAL